MKIKNNRYDIEINLLDNKPKEDINCFLDPDGIIDSDYIKYVYIKYKEHQDDFYKIRCIICDAHLLGDKYFVLKDNILTLMLNFTILKFDLNLNDIILVKDVDTVACNYELYYIDNDYLIIGEFEITRLDDSFNMIWQWSGLDIFDNVVVDFNKKLIFITEFMNSRSYSITFDGKE
ncbi:MAG: hypothetical protein LUG60_01625 [Erysipelotrichaceae bacterium]|nr:hypothetical protein [Erysipelotrichaceae bacterium]